MQAALLPFYLKMQAVVINTCRRSTRPQSSWQPWSSWRAAARRRSGCCGWAPPAWCADLLPHQPQSSIISRDQQKQK